MKAVNKFKKLVANKRPPIMSSILGEDGSPRFSQPPLAMQGDVHNWTHPLRSKSVTTFDRHPVEGTLAVEGIHRDMDMLQDPEVTTPDVKEDETTKSTLAPPKSREGGRSKAISSPPPFSPDKAPDRALQLQLSKLSTDTDDEEQYLAFRPKHPPNDSDRARSYDEVGRRGHARDPLQDHLYLYIGPSTFSGAGSNADRRATFSPNGEEDFVPVVSESPGAADIDIYETAYRDEIERIGQRRKEEGKDEEEPTVYLTRRVDARLLAVGQLAGRFMAKSEEGLDKFGAFTGWKDKKARVTDVSRALRAAAMEEYEKRRQERRQKEQSATSTTAAADATISTEAEGTTPPVDANKSTERQPNSPDQPVSTTQAPESGGASQSRTSSLFTQTALANKAIEKGRQAKGSFRSLIGMKKDRGST